MIIKIIFVISFCIVNNYQSALAISEAENVSNGNIKLIETLAEDGDITAQEFLSDYYKRTGDNSKAMYWAKKSIANLSPQGALIAALIERENGNKILSDKYSDMAAQYAFDSKDPYVASIMKSDMLQRGKKREAFLLSKLAADYGYEEEQIVLSFFYFAGIGTNISYKDAYIYGLIARKNGNKVIEKLLATLEENYIYESDIEALQREADILEEKIINNKSTYEIEQQSKVDETLKKIFIPQ
jgi:TPR repeat protein